MAILQVCLSSQVTRRALRSSLRWIILIAATAPLWLLWRSPVAIAQQASPPDAACITCHVGNTGTYTLPSGESFGVGVDLDVLRASIHGQHAAVDIYCTDCHLPRDRYLFPHQPNPAHTYAEFRAEVTNNCAQCHLPLDQHNPGHLQASDPTGLPNCADCHGGHDVVSTAAMVADPIGTCQSCHAGYGEEPAVIAMHEMVAGSLNNDPAGPTCQVCHGDVKPTSADAECKTCHSLIEGEITLPSGETIPLNVHPEAILASVHGGRTVDGVAYSPVRCIDCHAAESYTFPHTPLQDRDAYDARDYTLLKEVTCQSCHVGIFELNVNSVHAIAIAEGKREAASCSDCHGAHEVPPAGEPRANISHTCATCHGEIYDQYATSVHGAPLLGEDDPNVPVCTDCHGVHNIEDPSTARFRLQSPQMCGECHANEALMAQYGISTDVFDTYVADFHGTTVTLFERTHPDQETNKAVCYDCHGVHNILAANDENSRIIKENLLATCRECHPDASDNFPDSWTSHFKPSWEHNRIVYLVNLFYQILIPAVVGGFALFIGSDVTRRWWDRRRDKQQSKKGHGE